MRSFKAVCAVTVLLLAVSRTSAEEKVPGDTLAQMGLSKLTPISAQDGQAIRGKGAFAGVWGSIAAKWHGQSSSNNYSSGSSWFGKPAGASGGSFSFAGKFQALGRFGR